MDQLMTACLDGKMTESNDEEEITMPKTTCSKDTMTNTKEEEKGMESTTPKSKMGSNDVKSTPIKNNYTQYI
jgi:hypothetical protein